MYSYWPSENWLRLQPVKIKNIKNHWNWNIKTTVQDPRLPSACFPLPDSTLQQGFFIMLYWAAKNLFGNIRELECNEVFLRLLKYKFFSRFTRIRSWQRLSSLLNFANSHLQSTSLRASTSASGTCLLSNISYYLSILSYLQEQEPQPQEPVSYPIYYLILSFYLLKFTEQLSTDRPPLTNIISSDSSFTSFAFREQCQDFAQVRMSSLWLTILTKIAKSLTQDLQKDWQGIFQALLDHTRSSYELEVF